MAEAQTIPGFTDEQSATIRELLDQGKLTPDQKRKVAEQRRRALKPLSSAEQQRQSAVQEQMSLVRGPAEQAAALEEQRFQSRIATTERELGAPLRRDPGGTLTQTETPLIPSPVPQQIVFEAEQQFGLAPARDPTVEPPVIEFTQQADIARNPRARDAQKKLEERYGSQLEFRTIFDGEEEIIAVRQRGQPDFVLLNSEEFVSLTDMAPLASQFFSAEGLMTTAATIGGAGAGFLARTALTALGGATGRFADIKIEEQRGFSDEATGDIIADAAISGLIAGGADAIFTTFARPPLRASIGQGFKGLSPEVSALQKTAREMDIGGLTVGQAGKFGTRAESLAGQTSGIVKDAHNEQLNRSLKHFQRLAEVSDDDLASMNRQSMQDLTEAVEKDYMRAVGVGPADPLIAGQALIKGRKEFKRIWSAHIDKLYRNAIAESEGVRYDLAKAQDRAQKILDGVPMRGNPELAERALVAAEKTKGAPLTPAEKDIILRENVAIDPNGKFADQLKQILRLDPNVESFESVTAFEQLKQLRTELFDAKTPTRASGIGTPENWQAGLMWDELTEAMDNPIGGNPAFRQLYKEAGTANRRKEQILNMGDLKRIASTGDFEADQLMSVVTRPDNGGTLLTLSQVMPENEWETFRAQYKNWLVSKRDVNGRLDVLAEDPRALRVLLTPDEEAAIRLVADRKEFFQSNVGQKKFRQWTDTMRTTSEIALTTAPEAVADLIARSGGQNSRVGRALRAGVYAKLIAAGKRTTDKGVEILDPQAAVKFIDDLDNSGRLSVIFSSDEITTLKNKQAVMTMLRKTSDTGAGIAGAETVQQVTEAVKAPILGLTGQGAAAVDKSLAGATDLFKNVFVATVMTSKVGRAIMLGTGERQMDMTTLRALSALWAEAESQIIADTPPPER